MSLARGKGKLRVTQLMAEPEETKPGSETRQPMGACRQKLAVHSWEQAPCPAPGPQHSATPQPVSASGQWEEATHKRRGTPVHLVG